MTEINHFKLKQSSKLFCLLFSFYLVVLFLIVTYFSGWLQFGLILLLFLYLYLDFDRHRSAANTTLILNSRAREIQIEIEEISKNFNYFKLYSNRWFLVLQLRQKNRSENLLLISDRFHSMTEYLLFRHQIKKMNQNLNVD